MNQIVSAFFVVLLLPALCAACGLSELPQTKAEGGTTKVEGKNFRLDFADAHNEGAVTVAGLFDKRAGSRCKIDNTGMFRVFVDKGEQRLVLFDDDGRAGGGRIFIYDIPTCTRVGSLDGQAGELVVPPQPLKETPSSQMGYGTKIEPNRITIVFQCEAMTERVSECAPARIFDLDAACKPRLNAQASAALTKKFFGVVFSDKPNPTMIRDHSTDHAAIVDEPK